MKTLRNFGQRSGHQIPPVSIGAMRLPKDVDEAVGLIRYAIDNGLRYIDTSRGYGDSEKILGRALKDGYREKVILSTKWSPWVVKIDPQDDYSADSVRRRIEESMQRLQVDYLDYYQAWSIAEKTHYDQIIAKGGMVDGMIKAKEDGLIGHIGFTTHDTPENVLTYIAEADWCEIILFTYNLLNLRYAPCIEAAHRKGIGTVIMNPVGGGRLVEESPIMSKLAKEVGAASIADMAVRYVLSNPYVDSMLNGIMKPSDIDASLTSVERGPLSEEQLAIIDRTAGAIREQASTFCTGCRYCMPCPVGIDIPNIMVCIHDLRYWGLTKAAHHRYNSMQGPKASACTQCGQCETACTQKLHIMEEMKFAVETFE